MENWTITQAASASLTVAGRSIERAFPVGACALEGDDLLAVAVLAAQGYAHPTPEAAPAPQPEPIPAPVTAPEEPVPPTATTEED